MSACADADHLGPSRRADRATVDRDARRSPRRCATRRALISLHRLDHPLDVARLRVGAPRRSPRRGARPRRPPSGSARASPRSCSTSSRPSPITWLDSRMPSRDLRWCRTRSRGSASRSRRRCAPRSRRACGSRRPPPRSRGPPRRRARPRSRRSARAGSCACATLVMISVIWCTWRVFASSSNTARRPARRARTRVRIFVDREPRDVDARVPAFWFASAAKPNASRARPALRSIADAIVVDERASRRRAALLLRPTPLATSRDRGRDLLVPPDSASTPRVSSCDERSTRRRRRLHARRPARAGSPTIALQAAREISGLVAESAARGRARAAGARSPRLDAGRSRRASACEACARASATGRSRARRPRRARRTGVTHGATSTPLRRSERGEPRPPPRRRPASPGTNLCERATRTQGVSVHGAAVLEGESPSARERHRDPALTASGAPAGRAQKCVEARARRRRAERRRRASTRPISRHADAEPARERRRGRAARPRA